jgi:predicted DNA-binding protein (MmcQ/YjbR family)
MITTKTFREMALAFADVSEEPHFEKQSFSVKKKIFATLDEKNKRATLKLPEIEQSVFCAFDSSLIYPANGAWGKQGWTIFELQTIRKTMLQDALRIAYESLLVKKIKKKLP